MDPGRSPLNTVIDRTRTGGRVLVSSPASQHSYETAVAALEEDFLGCYVTGLYDTGRGISRASRVTWIPERLRFRIERTLRRRSHPELDAELVETKSGYYVAGYVLRRLLRAAGQAPRFERWAHWKFDSAVARWLKEVSPPAIVHAFENAALRTFEVARDLNIPRILDAPSAHEYFIEAILEEGGDISGLQQFAQAQAERDLANYVLVPSEYVERCLIERGTSKQKLRRVPYGVDPASFAPAPYRRARPFRALFVGQVGLRKGVSYLLDAWKQLSLPDAELVVVGPTDGLAPSFLRRDYGEVQWVGKTPKHEISAFFASSDLFVFPSLAEGSALVTYEAMASGLPVITTPNAGSVVRDGIDGFIVPPRDVDGLAEKIAMLYEDVECRRAMGDAARKRIERHYTWSHYRERVRAVYREALVGPPVTGLEAPTVHTDSGVPSMFGAPGKP